MQKRRLADVERALDGYRSQLHELEKISAAELRQRLSKNQAVLLDVRPSVEYRAGHLPGAILLIGWVLGLPVPWLILLAPSWGWVVAANLFLGANQGLAWTMTVTSKVDLVGPRQRGLALGINKFSDTAVWGLVPVAMASQGLGVSVIGLAAGVYALSWGAGQLITGALSDRVGRKPPIVAWC